MQFSKNPNNVFKLTIRNIYQEKGIKSIAAYSIQITIKYNFQQN